MKHIKIVYFLFLSNLYLVYFLSVFFFFDFKIKREYLRILLLLHIITYSQIINFYLIWINILFKFIIHILRLNISSDRKKRKRKRKRKKRARKIERLFNLWKSRRKPHRCIYALCSFVLRITETVFVGSGR